MDCPLEVQSCDSQDDLLENCTNRSFCEIFAFESGCHDLAFRFTASLAVSTAGTYSFRLASDAGSRLKLRNLALDAKPVVDNDGVHSELACVGDALLPEGSHALELEYFLGAGDAGLRLDYRGPDTGEQWALLGEAASLRPPDRIPAISLRGADPAYVLQGGAWREPGVECADEEDALLPVYSLAPSTAAAGTLSVRYECTDSLRHSVSANRTVVVRSRPNISLIGKSPTSVSLGRGFADLGACCYDSEGLPLSVEALGTINITVAGRYSRAYYCVDEDLGELAMAAREVIVDRPPSLTLMGSSTLRVIKGGSYTDEGMICQDAEDGWIAWSTSNVVEVLSIAQVETSDGPPLYTCDGCLNTTAIDATWVRFDLGDVRTVHGLRLQGATAGSVVCVGSSPEVDDRDPVCLVLTSSSDESACDSPLAGRYVTLKVSSPQDLETLCQVELLGTGGPGPPASVSMTVDGCSDLEALEGKYVISGVANEHPVYQGPAGHQLRRDNSDWWSLANESTEVARLVTSGSIASAVWQTPAEWPSSCQLRLQLDPVDACTWLFGYSSTPGHYQCADGHECPCSAGTHCLATCCEERGGLARCPPDKPQLCEQTMGNRSACAVDCASQGGVRKCRANNSVDDGRCVGHCAAKVETVGSINTSQPGWQSLFLSCVDSQGQRVGTSRLVEVACEGPNPDGAHGGNKVKCEGLLDTIYNLTDPGACAEECLHNLVCEAFEYEEGVCALVNFCDKRYYRDTNTQRQVGYCQNIDYPPSVLISSGPCCANVGDTYADAGASCHDLEDLVPWPAAAVQSLDLSTPGTYDIQYTCTDSAGHTEHGIRIVTVKADCAAPTGVADVAVAGACTEGTGPIPHGGTCTLQCIPGYSPSKQNLTCITSNDTDYHSRLESSFNCSPSPCNAPSVADVKSGASGPQSCQEGYQVPSGSICTPNCVGDGWPTSVPSVSSLSCLEGVLSPSSFRCKFPANKPDYILCEPSVVDAELSWAGGVVSSDCTFETWQVQARRTSVPTHDWHDIPGCPRQTSRGDGKGDCHPTNLTEGATYEFRVRETCTDEDMKSPWATTANITMGTVPTPEVLFATPQVDVLSDPGQIMVAFSQACATVADDTIWVTVSQSGDYCTGQIFATRASDIDTSTLTGQGVQLAGERILIISTESGFFQPGCKINVSLSSGLIQTLQTPAKPSPPYWWNFTYIDARPEVVFFARLGRSTGSGSFRIRWSEPTTFDCTASPMNETACIQKAVWEGEILDAAQVCSAGQSQHLEQLSAIAHVEFQIQGLYPGVEYQIHCSGHKRGKPWVLTMPEPATDSVEMDFQTEEDVSREISTMDLKIFAVCQDGRTDLRQTEEISQTDMASGHIAQILDYKIACINGAELLPGEQAKLRIVASTARDSAHSTITWLAGPVMDITYTEPQANMTSSVEQLFRFRICPLATASSHFCQNYELPVRALNVRFSFGTSLELEENNATGFDSGQYVVSMGAHGKLSASSSDPAFDWSEVIMYLGDTAEGFRLPTSFSADKLSFRFYGQGTSLPLGLAWRGAMFRMNILVSFVPPGITFNPLQASLLESTLLEVSLSQVPNCTELPLQVPAIPMEAGYADPARYVQLLVVKSGRPAEENLCGGTYFGSDGCWWSASCTLAPAALENVTVRPLVYDSAAREFRAAGSAEAGGIAYAAPVFTGLLDEAGGAADTAPVDLGLLANRSAAELALLGAGLPSPEALRLGGARFGGYHVELEGPEGERRALCSEVSAVDEGRLLCVLSRCINVSVLAVNPDVRMYLGDLVAAERVRGRLVLPRPVVGDFGPREVGDVGPNRTMWFRGWHFTERSCRPESPDPLQLVGLPAGVQVSVGTSNATCYVASQNDTYVECEFRDTLMEAISADYVGDDLPPTRRSAVEQIGFSACRRFESRNADSESGFPALQVQVVLSGCPAGMRREQATSHVCIPCPRGRSVTTSSTHSPLRCESCPEGRYQDQVGASACKDCPANTGTLGGAIALTDCLCKPGYYSQYLDTATGAAAAGTSCVACHGEDMTDVPLAGESCGDGIPVADACSEEARQVCVREGAGAPDGALRLCRAYCPGGTSWPRAKSSFWLRSNDRGAEPGELGLPRYAPVIVRCDPPGACLGDNLCDKMYKGEVCDECVFGYFRGAQNLCEECGADQLMGELALVAAAVVLTVGGLAAMSIYIRAQADLQFAQELLTLLNAYVVHPIKKSTFFMRLLGRSEQRRTVVVRTGDVGRSLSYAKKQDLGMVFRVDDEHVAHLAGLSLTSPMKGKVEIGWKLQTVNGHRLSARSEDDVQALLRESELPIRLTFSAPRNWNSSGGQSNDFDFAQDRKMLIVMLGILNSFVQCASFDFRWPKLFRLLVELASKLSFNFQFVRPECSVEMPAITKWTYMVLSPYTLIIPLLLAYGIASVFTLCNQRGPGFATRSWLLMNAFARCCCLAFIFLLPYQLDLLLVPLACIKDSSGVAYVSEMPETKCTLDDGTYLFMCRISAGGLLVVLAFFSMLLVCLHKSFRWQAGTSCVRDYVPFYVAMVEVSTFGQRGYVGEVRDRVFSNVCAPRAFHVRASKLERRRLLAGALDQLGDRSRPAVLAARKARAAGAGRGAAGPRADADEAAEPDKADARQRFQRAARWPDQPDGNVVTYGWVIIVNLFWRQLATLGIIKLTKGNLIVIGAAFQLLVYIGNVTMLICLKPYQSMSITRTEGLLLSVLFMLLWSAVLKDLLENHRLADSFVNEIAQVGSFIDGLAVLLVGVALVVPLYQAIMAGKNFLNASVGPDVMLNKLYMMQYNRKEKERKEAELNTFRDMMDRDKDEDTVEILAAKLPHLHQALAEFQEAGLDQHVDLREQQRILVRLAKVVRRIDEWKQRRRELDLAVDGQS